MSALTSAAAPLDQTTATDSAERSPRENRYDRLSSIAGLLAVVAGLLSLIAVSVAAIFALPSDNGQNVVAVTTGSFGVIGTVVGAYSGSSSAPTGDRRLSTLSAPKRPRSRRWPPTWTAMRPTGR